MFYRIWNTCKSIFISLAVFLSIFFGAIAHGQDKIYRVDGSNTVTTGDGSGWGSSSIKFLQDALQDARDYLDTPGNEMHSVEIWVAGDDDADGIAYFPDRDSSDPTGSGSRSASFSFINNVHVKGGFSGGVDEQGNADDDFRDIETYLTVLSGDVGLTICDPDCHEQDSYHVLSSTSTTINSTAIYSGFTIESGYADGGNNLSIGGGVFILDGSPVVRECVIAENHADSLGGGVGVIAGVPVFRNCIITGNNSGSNGGGFAGNHGRLLHTVIEDNTAFIHGGGIYSEEPVSARLTIASCVVRNNEAEHGSGGGILLETGNFILSNTEVTRNVAGSDGGGI